MTFTAGQVLVKATEIEGDDLEALSSIKGEVAGKLGKLLVEHYKADKIALNFKAAEKLKTNKKVVGKKSLTYTIEVDAKIKAIELCLQSSRKEIARVEILGGLNKLDTGATVVNLQKGDTTVDSSTGKLAKGENGPSAKPNELGDTLSGINAKKRIVLCGHGHKADVTGDLTFTADRFGGKTADEIVKFLIKEGLAKGYTGTIFLVGCHTASGYKDPNSFASKVHSTLAGKGYKSLSVAGTPGETWVKDGGGTGSIPDAVNKDLAETIKRVETQLAKLEKALETGEKDFQLAESQMKSLEDQYVAMRELILEMPPEAREMLEDKLMTPLKNDRDELAPAVREMQRSNKSLDGAIKSEKAYLVKLNKLASERKKLEDGTITKSDYNRKEEELFTVDDWWGVFGPAKATSAKVKKKTEKTESLFTQFKNKFKKKDKAGT